MSMQSFADLGVSKAVSGALAERGITVPFAVQQRVVRHVHAGHSPSPYPPQHLVTAAHRVASFQLFVLSSRFT